MQHSVQHSRGAASRRRFLRWTGAATAASLAPGLASSEAAETATPPAAEIETTYVALWDAGQRAVLSAGGNLSHHHGVGLNRARFVGEALGAGADVLASVKRALDPNGILNPGKLGLASPFGDNPFAQAQWP